MQVEYTVIKSKRKTIGLEIKSDGQIIVRAPKWLPDKEIRKFVEEHEKWIIRKRRTVKERLENFGEVEKLTVNQLNELKNKAKSYIPQRVAYFAPIVGVTYGKITIKSQKTLWGSCSSKGNLNFNCLLMMMPNEVIDSVVVHELCHRKYMNHSKKFYDEVLRVYPNYYRCNKWIKENGSQILLQIK